MIEEKTRKRQKHQRLVYVYFNIKMEHSSQLLKPYALIN